MAIWTRIGVQRCRRRYAGLGPGQLVSLFNNVAQTVGPLLYEEGEVGDYIAVAINPRERTCEARVMHFEARHHH